MNIDDLRKEIDEIDNQLIAIFEKRMATVAKISECKKKNGFSVQDTGREQEILNRISLIADGDMPVYVNELYKTILNISRRYQEQLKN